MTGLAPGSRICPSCGLDQTNDSDSNSAHLNSTLFTPRYIHIPHGVHIIKLNESESHFLELHIITISMTLVTLYLLAKKTFY